MSGSERIRLAVIRDRDQDPPAVPVVLCGGDPTGALTVREWEALASARTAARHRTPLSERLVVLVHCPACLRFRWSPGHWVSCS